MIKVPVPAPTSLHSPGTGTSSLAHGVTGFGPISKSGVLSAWSGLTQPDSPWERCSGASGMACSAKGAISLPPLKPSRAGLTSAGELSPVFSMDGAALKAGSAAFKEARQSLATARRSTWRWCLNRLTRGARSRKSVAGVASGRRPPSATTERPGACSESTRRVGPGPGCCRIKRRIILCSTRARMVAPFLNHPAFAQHALSSLTDYSRPNLAIGAVSHKATGMANTGDIGT